tara:strand:+ start:23919 stop:24740 length:822 start_codon:yes stop_codon:yes gene_type:complete
MLQPHFRTRRIIALAITAIAILIVWIFAWIETSRLGHASYVTGWTTLSTLFLLILLGVRRRVPMLRLGSASTWTQVHLYSGLFATAVYAMHVPSLIAGGTFECGLSIVFLLVSASGFYGVYASRTLPRRLTAVDGQHRFDRVRWHRNQIAETAASLLEGDNDNATSRVLGIFYTKYLMPFFQTRPSLAYVMVPTGARRRRLLGGLQELNRYLESDGRQVAGRFAALVRRRDDLDYQFSLQLRLRLWLVIHSTFSIVLVLWAIIHAVLAIRFTI